jgi:hypothetical protein
MSGLAVLVGGSLLTAGILIYLREILGSWPLALVLAGAFYLGVAALIRKTRERSK